MGYVLKSLVSVRFAPRHADTTISSSWLYAAFPLRCQTHAHTWQESALLLRSPALVARASRAEVPRAQSRHL